MSHSTKPIGTDKRGTPFASSYDGPPSNPSSPLRSRFSDTSLAEQIAAKSSPFKSSILGNIGGTGYKANLASGQPNSNHQRSFSKEGSVLDSIADTEPFPDVVVEDTDSVVGRSGPGPSRKAAQVLGINHSRSMEPIPSSARSSLALSTRSVRSERKLDASNAPTLPLASLYCVSGLPKSPNTWTLSDPDSVAGLHHSESAVNRWWRPEILGSTVSPGAGGKRKKHQKVAGALSKPETAKVLSKALKLSFTRDVEVIASTLQPASTVHTFSFTVPASKAPLAPASTGDLRASAFSDARGSVTSFAHPYSDDPFARPSSAYLGPPAVLATPARSASLMVPGAGPSPNAQENTVEYYGVCLQVWSHADSERTAAIRRTLEVGRMRKESAQSLVASRLKHIRGENGDTPDVSVQARRKTRKNARSPWGEAETDAETEGAMSESDFETSTIGHGPGESTLFLPGDTVFWLPYCLTLVSRHPVYDLMRDYLTLSWARFSKDVTSHSLQISKILAHPAPRAGDLVRLDASPKSEGDASLEVVARFPGGLDFGKGLVDVNFSFWPLFKCLNVDNILTICEIALAPTGRILFVSRHPALLGIAVNTIKYLLEFAHKWNGVAFPAVHARDLKILIEDPGPWIMGVATEARFSVRPSPEICVCDLDINYINCPSPPPGAVSVKKQRDKFRERLLAAFDAHYHPDHGVPTELKEAFPAGRFRPFCKIQAKRGAAAAVADPIQAPEWWHPRIIQAFANVLQDKFKKPSFIRRISSFGGPKKAPQLTAAEQHVQLSIRRRTANFVDARDDLESRIGRLSRRLNFLMTESDLWRDKFVTFENYAEKLSVEAGQLRTKISKEQKETKRLSGIVTLTAAEKNKLQAQLKDTEVAQKGAMAELRKMKAEMERMEREREEERAEIEAQIERALASMHMPLYDESDSDYEGSTSRPTSRMSSRSGTKARSRRASDATARSPASVTEPPTVLTKLDRDTGTIEEGEEEEEDAAKKKKRFSASADLELRAVDEGIAQKSDKIAQKVHEIQQKLESALKNPDTPPDSEEEKPVRSRPAKNPARAKINTTKSRTRSGTASSAQTAVGSPQDDSLRSTPRKHSRAGSKSSNVVHQELPSSQPSDGVAAEPRDAQEPLNSSRIRKISSGASLSAMPAPSNNLTPSATSLATDESDTDFQSAVGSSPASSDHDGDASSISDYGDAGKHKKVGSVTQDGKARRRKQQARGSVSTVRAN